MVGPAEVMGLSLSQSQGKAANVLIDLRALPSPTGRVMKVEYGTQGSKPQMSTEFYSATQVTRYIQAH